MIRKDFLIGAILLAVIVLALAVQAVYGKSGIIPFTNGLPRVAPSVGSGMGHTDGIIVFHRYVHALNGQPSHLG